MLDYLEKSNWQLEYVKPRNHCNVWLTVPQWEPSMADWVILGIPQIHLGT